MATEDVVQYPDFTIKRKQCNLILSVEDQALHVHKEFLIVMSPVFDAMCNNDFIEKSSNVIPLDDKNAKDVTEFLLCLYPPEKPLDDDNIDAVLQLSDEYQVDTVKRRCEDFLLQKEAGFEMLLTAQNYRLPRLLQHCIHICKDLRSTVKEIAESGKLNAENANKLLLEYVTKIEEIENASMLAYCQKVSYYQYTFCSRYKHDPVKCENCWKEYNKLIADFQK